MNSTSRFACPSSSATLKRLLGKSRRALWISFALGIAAHISLSQIGGFEAEQKVVKPLTTQFIKRQPRLTKPLELKKRPRPKRRRIERKMVAVKAKVDRQHATSRIPPSEMMQKLARPALDFSRVVGTVQLSTEPRTIAEAILTEKRAKKAVDMSLDMVDLTVLDTGKYHAMVVQDPSDKRNLQGFFHLAFVYSVSMTKNNCDFHNRTHRAIKRLVEAMNKSTAIKTDFARSYTFDSAELFRTPWIHLNAYSTFKFTEGEAHNFGKYLVSGGFTNADRGTILSGPPEWHWFYFATTNGFKDALATQGYLYGRDWTYVRLPNDHPVYHCYFDFDGPPAGYYTYVYPMPYQDGIFIEDRMVAVCQYWQRYFACWGEWPLQRRDNTRQLQFAINTIIFALTQEGSITHRLMESVAY